MPDAALVERPRSEAAPEDPVVRAARLAPALTSLVGRERAVEQVAALLRRPEVRLVTLSGPGGVGKTRLALAVADRVGAAFADGACVVPLAALRDPGLVLPAVARALGVREVGDRPLAAVLAAALRDRELLLVLDNLEQVLDAAPLVGDLLAAGPGLTALATSREPLRVSGERVVRVPPLALPDAVVVVEDAPAIRLFLERARAARAGFALTPDNAPAVAAVCRRLDGLPLAIELAAARIALFTPEELLDRLDRRGGGRLPLLTGGPRDVPERQRTLRDAIAWSHDLLDPDEQSLFRCLAVFAGGFDLELAEAVVGAVAPALDAIDGVGALVAKSLLVRTDGDAGGSRFGMLETVREFALVALAASGDEEAVRRAHAAACLALAERAGADLLGTGRPARLDRLEAEHDNLRAALAWAEAAGDAATLGRLAVALAGFWRLHWHHGEGERWLGRALALGDGGPSVARAEALLGAGVMACMRCDYASAADFHGEAAAVAQDLGDPREVARALFHLGGSHRHWGDARRAQALLAEALAIARGLGEDPLAALALMDLGDLAAEHGDHERAISLLDEALALCEAAGFGWGRAEALARLADVRRDRGDRPGAVAALGDALERYCAQGDVVGIARAAIGLALLAGERGDAGGAVRLYAAAAALHRASGVREPQEKHPEQRARLDGFRARLGNEGFAAAWSQGRALPREAVVEAARALAAALASAVPGAGPNGTEEASYPAGLSGREAEVLRLVAAGLTNAEVGARLFISPRTVNAHLNRIYGKLGIAGRAGAVRFAAEHGLT